MIRVTNSWRKSKVSFNTNRHIEFSPPDITKSEIKEVTDTLLSGWITTGPRTKQLESNLAKFLHVNKVICLNSATSAEEMTLRLLGIGKGDEVIVPAYTYTSTAAAAIHVGAKVIFADIQKNGDVITHAPEMDYSKVEQLINEKTKAIIPVDIAGVMCDYKRLFEIAESKKNLFRPSNEFQKQIGRIAIVADCAHSLGAQRDGKMAGEAADFSSFSFHAVKNFTTAEGGAATWNLSSQFDNEVIYNQLQLFSLHGQSKDALAKTKLGAWEYDIIGPWYKCNMTDIMASMGLKQLERYPDLLAKRKHITQMYDEICDTLNIAHIAHYGKTYSSSAHLYLARIPKITVNQRNEIIMKMAESGIATNVHYKPLPMMSAYKSYGWDIKNFPNSYDYYHNLISLPLHTLLSDDDVEYVIDNWKRIVKEYIKV